MTPLSMPVFVLVNGSDRQRPPNWGWCLEGEQAGRTGWPDDLRQELDSQSVSLNQAPHGSICVTWAQFFVPNTPTEQVGIAPTIAVDAGSPSSGPARWRGASPDVRRHRVMRWPRRTRAHPTCGARGGWFRAVFAFVPPVGSRS